MESNGYLNLKYAEEFRIACTINNLRYEEVLQRFIDHVSLYAFKGGTIEPMFRWATQVMVDCTAQYNEEIKMPLADQSVTNFCATRIDLNELHTLNLTADFNLLCHLNGLNALQILQYFIDNTSLAEDRALNLYEIVDINPSTAVVLLMLVRDKTKSKHLLQEKIYVEYALKLLELDERLEDESNIPYKIKQYQHFYFDWYNALRVIVN